MRRFTNAHLHQMALSDAHGTAEIYVPIKKSGKIGPGLAHLGAEKDWDFASEPIVTTTLDAWMSVSGLDTLDFIKCDVEGAELLMLRGAERTIEHYRPGFFLEVAEHFTRRMGYEPSTLFEFLYTRGYESFTMDFSRCTLVPVIGHQGTGDYVFKIKG